MVLSNIPHAIDAFIASLTRRDVAHMRSLLTDDASLEHEGTVYDGNDIAAWSAKLLGGRSLQIQAIGINVDGARALVNVLVQVNAGAGHDAAVLHMDWHVDMRGALIRRVVIGPAVPLLLPAPVAAFMGAMNRGDLDGVVASFAAGALVNDQLHDYLGEAAIRAWAAADLIDDQVRMAVVKLVEVGDNVTVTTHVEGNFDKRGLPEPLVLTLYFNLCHDRIAQLIILHNLKDL